MTKVPALSASLLSIAIAACSLLGQVPLRTARAPSDICMAALLTGTLVRNPNSGLGVSNEGRDAIAVEWPFGYSAREELGRIALLDVTGTVLAREGDEVSMGGGFGANDEVFLACGAVTATKATG